MYTINIDANTSYQFNPKDLVKIEFPILQENVYSILGVNFGYNVIPIRYNLKAKNDKIVILSGKTAFSKNRGIKNIEVKTQFSMDIIANSLVIAIKQNIGIEKIPAIKIRIDAIAKALCDQLAEYTSDCVILNRVYKIPAFVIMNQEVIGIGNKTIFKMDNQTKKLDIEIKQMIGSYLSKINAQKNTIHLIILNNKGEPFISMPAKVHNVYNTCLTASGSFTKFRYTSSMEICKKIFKKYNKNYMSYFTEQEEDIFGDFSIF